MDDYSENIGVGTAIESAYNDLPIFGLTGDTAVRMAGGLCTGQSYLKKNFFWLYPAKQMSVENFVAAAVQLR